MAEASLEGFTGELQRAYASASGGPVSNEERIRKKWREVAQYVLAGTQEKSDVHHLAVELHLVFIGEGHRTEIEHRAKNDPVLLGWRGVARLVIEREQRQPRSPSAACALNPGFLVTKDS